MTKCPLWGTLKYKKQNIHVKDFCNLFKLKNLIKFPKCFKNLDNPKTTDLILTNSVCSFQNSCSIEIGLPDFHRMTVTVLKSYLEKKQPKSFLIGNLVNRQTMILERRFCEILGP